MEAVATLTAIYMVGDPHPLVVKLPVEQVAARLLDAEAQAVECGLSPARGFARFAGKYGPALVRPSAVSSITTVKAPEEDDE